MSDENEQDGGVSGWRIGGRIFLQLLALSGIVAVAVYFFDFGKVRKAVRNLSATSIAIFVGIMLLVRVINSWRWLSIAAESMDISNLSLGFMTRVTLLAQFTNIWFPSFIGGEFVRVWKVGRRVGSIRDISKEVPLSVMVDRVIGLASLAVLCLPFLVLFPKFMPDIQRSLQNPYLLWGGVAFVVVLVAGVAWKYEMVVRLLRRTIQFIREEQFLVKPMLISALGYAVIVIAYLYLLRTLDAGTFLQIAAVTLIPRFGRISPVLVLGVGAVEGGTIVVGEYLGISSQILVVIVAAHVTSKYVASLLGALLEVGFEGRNSLRELADRAESQSVPDATVDAE